MAREVTAAWRRDSETEVRVAGHVLLLDASLAHGGTDAGPTPGETLLAALAACKIITIRQFADRRQWPLTGIAARLALASAKGAFESIDVELRLDGPLTGEQRERLLAVARHCPVSRALERGVPVRVSASTRAPA
jgi:putative redox protein